MIVQPLEIQSVLGLTSPDPILTYIHPLVEHMVFDWLRRYPAKRENVEYYPINVERQQTDGGSMYIDVRNGSASITPMSYIAGDMLFLKNTPVWNDSTFEIRCDYGARAGQGSSPFPNSTILTKGTDYWIDVTGNGNMSDSGIIYRVAGVWPTEPRSIKVTYNGGWSQTQLDGQSSDGSYIGAVKLAITQTLVHNYRELKVLASQGQAGIVAGPITSESLGPYSYSISRITSGAFEVSIPTSALRMLQPHRSYRGIY